VELLDGGAPGLDFFKLVKESAFLVFVDTVSGTSRPGEVLLIRDTEQVLTQLSNAGQGIGPANRSDLMDLLNGNTGAEVVLVGLVPPVSNVTLWRAAEMSLVLADGETESADKPRIAWTA
jgi:Ni,Fe-hydrogenase maturation factor